MLTKKELAEIRKRWIEGDIPTNRRIAYAEQDIPALLETVEELRELVDRAMPSIALLNKRVATQLKESLR